MNNAFREERNLLFKSYLDRHVFSSWRCSDINEASAKPKWHDSLELIFTSACNTECTYCYYKNFGDKLNPIHKNDKNTVLHNLEALLKYLKKENLKPRSIEIFSGEFFKVPYCEEALDLLDEYLDSETSVMIPTNCTFALREVDTDKVKKLLSKYNNLKLCLSLSTDGALSDNISRPLRNKQSYNTEYYERLFKFAKDYKCAFHPMISPDNIFYWKENFEWFLTNIQKYSNVSEREALNYLYLLEVRNPNWNKESLKALDEFIEYLIDRTFKIYNCNVENYCKDFLLKRKLNIFSGIVSTVSRGLGCSIQQTFAIRLHDLGIVNCHRTSYEKYLGGYFKEGPNGDLFIEAENPNVYMLINSFDFKHSPSCNSCPISHLCSLSCIGCNFEVNRDFFIPVRSVCELERRKLFTEVKSFYERGILQEILKKDSVTYALQPMIVENKSVENNLLRIQQLFSIVEEMEKYKNEKAN